MTMNKKIEAYIENASTWSDALRMLREIVCSTDLDETVKWGAPCYTFAGRNVVAIVAVKAYFGLWFYDAESLPDPDSVLQPAQGGKSKSMRQWRFTSKDEIKRRTILAYLRMAMVLSKSSAPPKSRNPNVPVLPPELKSALSKTRNAQESFNSLTPGKQREYARHIAEAKRDATKRARIERILPLILAGKSLHERYK